MINLTNDQKERVTEWVEENRKFQNGDIVTVDYDGDGMRFANSEFGGVPLQVVGVHWRDVDQVSEVGLHSYKEHDEEHKLIKLFDGDDIHPESNNTEYAIVKIEYDLDIAVRSEMECRPSIPEVSLIDWDEYDGNLRFHTRGSDSTASLVDGEDCPICHYTAEKHTTYDNGYISAGMVECAVCGFVKRRSGP